MGDAEAAIKERYRLVGPLLDERQRRRFAATEARTFGRGGIAAAARACGLAENTVRKGLGELDDPEPLGPERVRKPGAGRKRVEDSDPELLDDLRSCTAAIASRRCCGRPRAYARSRTSWRYSDDPTSPASSGAN